MPTSCSRHGSIGTLRRSIALWREDRSAILLAAAVFWTAAPGRSGIAAPAAVVRPSGASAWTTVGGAWSFGKGTARQSILKDRPAAFWTKACFTDATLDVRFRTDAAGPGVRAAGLILRSMDSGSGYCAHLDARNRQVILYRKERYRMTELGRRRGIDLACGVWHRARFSAVGRRLRLWVDGREVLDAADGALTKGVVGLYTSQGRVEFRDITARGASTVLDRPWRTRRTWEVRKVQTRAEILWTRVLCKEPGRYIGWPTVCRTRDGRLLVVFSGDRDAHICPWGKVQMVESGDDGETWSAPVVICNTPLDDRDAGILQTRRGTLVVAWFTSLAFEGAAKAHPKDPVMAQWRQHALKLTPSIRRRWLGYWTRRSTDGGRTWTPPVRTRGSAPHGPIELSDGRLLYVGRRNPHKNTELTVEESRDDGQSWRQIASVPVGNGDDPNEFHEPHAVETEDGRIVALFRYHYRDPKTGKRDIGKCFLRQSESEDGGRTWTPTHPTPILGYPPHLIRLRDGKIVCVYGRRIPPYGEYACISDDDGRTWDVDNEIQLASAINGDLGYPASAELEDGSILTVYYQIDTPGEKTCLMGTRWRVRRAAPKTDGPRK